MKYVEDSQTFLAIQNNSLCYRTNVVQHVVFVSLVFEFQFLSLTLGSPWSRRPCLLVRRGVVHAEGAGRNPPSRISACELSGAFTPDLSCSLKHWRTERSRRKQSEPGMKSISAVVLICDLCSLTAESLMEGGHKHLKPAVKHGGGGFMGCRVFLFRGKELCCHWASVYAAWVRLVKYERVPLLCPRTVQLHFHSTVHWSRVGLMQKHWNSKSPHLKAVTQSG